MVGVAGVEPAALGFGELLPPEIQGTSSAAITVYQGTTR